MSSFSIVVDSTSVFAEAQIAHARNFLPSGTDSAMMRNDILTWNKNKLMYGITIALNFLDPFDIDDDTEGMKFTEYTKKRKLT